jgi:hypothetical protein
VTWIGVNFHFQTSLHANSTTAQPYLSMSAHDLFLVLDICICSTMIYPICLLCSVVCSSRQNKRYAGQISHHLNRKTPSLKSQNQDMCKKCERNPLPSTPKRDSAPKSRHHREPQATSIGSSTHCQASDCTLRSLPGVAASP